MAAWLTYVRQGSTVAALLHAVLAKGAAGGQLGRFDAWEGLAVDTESVEPDGKKPEALGTWNHNAQRFAVDLYGDGTAASGL
jgi:hypothetical protein